MSLAYITFSDIVWAIWLVVLVVGIIYILRRRLKKGNSASEEEVKDLLQTFFIATFDIFTIAFLLYSWFKK